MGDSLGPSGLSVVGYGLLRFPKMLALKRVLPPFRFVIGESRHFGHSHYDSARTFAVNPARLTGARPLGLRGLTAQRGQAVRWLSCQNAEKRHLAPDFSVIFRPVYRRRG